jgi:hypothetical protein
MCSAKNNDIAVSGAMNIFVDELPKMEGKGEGDNIAQEVKVAVERKVCTFQLTGSHYRLQRVGLPTCFVCKADFCREGVALPVVQTYWLARYVRSVQTHLPR